MPKNRLLCLMLTLFKLRCHFCQLVNNANITAVFCLHADFRYAVYSVYIYLYVGVIVTVRQIVIQTGCIRVFSNKTSLMSLLTSITLSVCMCVVSAADLCQMS